MSKANRFVWVLDHLLKAKHLSRSAKLRIYKTVPRLMLSQGCESWVVNKNEQQALITLETTIIRRILGERKTENGYIKGTS